MRSRWVTTETTLAIELEHKDILRFIPVKVASCRPPLLWTAYQCVPFTPRYDTGLAALLAALATRQSPIAAQPPPVVAPSARPARPQRAKKARPQPVARKAEVEPTVATLAPSPDAFVITAPIRLELVRIPAGEFLMGSDPARDPQAFLNEQPQHLVHLPEFSIGKCPVTNDQYALFAKETNHRMPDHWPDGQVPAGCGAHPVVFVSWPDAVAFCAWLSQATGQPIRLPTEAEWDRAARGPDGRLYPWGNQAPATTLCNSDNNVGGTTPSDTILRGRVPVAPWIWQAMYGNGVTACARTTLTALTTAAKTRTALAFASCAAVAGPLPRTSCDALTVPGASLPAGRLPSDFVSPVGFNRGRLVRPVTPIAQPKRRCSGGRSGVQSCLRI